MVAMYQSKYWPSLFPKDIPQGQLGKLVCIGHADRMIDAFAKTSGNRMHGRKSVSKIVGISLTKRRYRTILPGQSDEGDP